MTDTAALSNYNRSVDTKTMPDRIRRLPISPTGYPVPWFVAWFDKDGKPGEDGQGTPDFRVVHPKKIVTAVGRKLCWVCGTPLGIFKCFVIGPMCAVNRVISEPPSHRECAVWSARASCPFLSKPNMVRNDKGMYDADGKFIFQEAAGLALKRNPGAVCVWVTKSFRPFNAQELGQPRHPVLARPAGRGAVVCGGSPCDTRAGHGVHRLRLPAADRRRAQGRQGRTGCARNPARGRDGSVAAGVRGPHQMIRRFLLWIVVWFRRVFFISVPVDVTPAPAPEPPAPIVDEVGVPPPLSPPPSPYEPPKPEPTPIFVARPAKSGMKPKGDKPRRHDSEPKTDTETVRTSGHSSKPKTPRPELRTEDPEQWGQYYFRDAILDQLDTYFTYLKRMKVHDRDAYDMHSRLGIQIMPQSAVQSFDNWRQDKGDDELSAWWKTNRPGFGAVSYGIDAASLDEENAIVADLSPEQWAQLKGRTRTPDDLEAGHRMATATKGPQRSLPDGHKYDSALIWVPKFLYFTKWSKVPPDVQRITGGDVLTR